MAIGDTPNQNLFGTNYNAEEEKKKKAELAAQGAMMGATGGTQDPLLRSFEDSLLRGQSQNNPFGQAGIQAGQQFANNIRESRDLPASAFGQAPAVTPFSMEAAGQVNPMMQAQSLEATPQAPAGLPVETSAPMTNNVANGGMQLREPKQTDGGVLGLGSVDVESPLAMTGTPDFSNLNLNGVNLQIPPELQFKTPGTSEVGLTNLFQEGSLPRMVTEAAGATGDVAMDKGKGLAEFLTGQEFFTGDKTAGEVEGSLAFLQSPEVQARMKAAQAPSGASTIGATQGVTTPVETPIEGAQGQTAALDPTSDEAILARRAQREAQFSPQGLMGQDATRAALGGMTLNEYLSAPAGTEGVSGLRTDPQGRMIPAGFETRAEAFPDFERESAAREARLDARPDFNEAISDRDRRAARGDGISMADQVDMAKANARGATPREIARGNQVANALGVDLKTGQPPEATGGLTFDQIMKLEEFDFKRGQEAYKRSQDDLVAQGKKTEAFEQDSALLRQVSGDAGRIGRLTNEAIGITTEPGTTALSGSLLKHVAGSNANQLKSILEVISSKVALDRLMEVKKTGATLGQVSEKELAMLQSSFDALQQSLPPERLREALTNYANQLKKVEDQTQRAFIDKHGQEKFNKIMGGGSMGQGEPRYANDQDVGDSADTYYNPSK